MSDIRHRLGIFASQGEVHHAIATTEGVASWWNRTTAGDATEGGKLELTFREPDRLVLEVLEATPERIEWRCLEGPEEWLPTSFTFELAAQGDETVLLFAHGGWLESVAFQARCSTKRAYFLVGMKAMLEGGEATRFPGELQISSWG